VTSLGKFNVEKQHCLAFTDTPFSSSAYLQELACYAGQQAVFEEASQMLLFIGGVELNAKQIERVCHYHGQQLEEAIEKEIKTGSDKFYPDAMERHYVMIDGSMYLTREEKWKEMKLGRIFKDSENIGVSKHRGMITKSEYVCHLGSHTDFFEKLGVYTEALKQPVFINDGARWIWNWVDAYYPDAAQILDFFHAKEHLCQFAKEYFRCPDTRKQWTKEQSDKLLDDKVGEIIETLKGLETTNKRQVKARQCLVDYYQNNLKRMQYKTFRKKGLLIGSGAIEAAHRDILQQRLKLSGQRWTKQGIQQLANLRILYKSNKLGNQRQLIKCAA
jgi:hypothetical protein